jgi:hypothetical protein
VYNLPIGVAANIEAKGKAVRKNMLEKHLKNLFIKFSKIF